MKVGAKAWRRVEVRVRWKVVNEIGGEGEV